MPARNGRGLTASWRRRAAPAADSSLRRWGLAAYWAAVNFQSSALPAIVLPVALLRLAGGRHAEVLARLSTLGALVAMVVPPAAGAVSDRLRRRGGSRHAWLWLGTAVNATGLVAAGRAATTASLTAAFLVLTFGQNVALAAYEAIMPETVSRDRWGAASGEMGILTLAGTVAGLLAADVLPAAGACDAMAAVAVAAAAVSGLSVGEGDGPRAVRRRADSPRPSFAWVFAARFLVFFGQTLLMTFVLYFFQDAMRVSRPDRYTAAVAGLALAGAGVSTLAVGRASDRADRVAVVFWATLLMAGAALGFAAVPRLSAVLALALVWGVGYGAYLSVDWALALDALPDLVDVGRDLGVWGIAGNLAAVVAPAVGGAVVGRHVPAAPAYRSLFLLAGLGFLAGAVVVLGADARRRERARTLPFVGLVALVLGVYVRLAYRVVAWGRLPPRRGATLVISNHVHDLEGMVLPAWLFAQNRCRPVYAVGSQRLFEPGFLASRGPRWLRPLLPRLSIGPLLWALGVRPLENAPLARPAGSWAHAVASRHGDLPLTRVFVPAAAEALARAVGRAAAAAMLSHLKARPLMETPVLTFTALREPYRGEVRRELRRQIEGQLDALARLLRQGNTLYLTPEGRLTPTGGVGRFRAALDRLLPLAECVLVAGVSYDPWNPGRLRMLFRVVPPADPGDVRTSVMAARPVTASQVVAAVLLEAGALRTDEEIRAAVRRHLRGLPPGAAVDPWLRRDPDAAVDRVLAEMRRRGVVEAVDGGLRPRPGRRDPRFPHVPDLLLSQATHHRETCRALAILAERGRLAGWERAPAPPSP